MPRQEELDLQPFTPSSLSGQELDLQPFGELDMQPSTPAQKSWLDTFNEYDAPWFDATQITNPIADLYKQYGSGWLTKAATHMLPGGAATANLIQGFIDPEQTGSMEPYKVLQEQMFRSSGDVATELSRPSNAVPTLLSLGGAGAAKAGLGAAVKPLIWGARATSVPAVAHGGMTVGEEFTGEEPINWGNVAMGTMEMAGGAAGMFEPIPHVSRAAAPPPPPGAAPPPTPATGPGSVPPVDPNFNGGVGDPNLAGSQPYRAAPIVPDFIARKDWTPPMLDYMKKNGYVAGGQLPDGTAYVKKAGVSAMDELRFQQSGKTSATIAELDPNYAPPVQPTQPPAAPPAQQAAPQPPGPVTSPDIPGALGADEVFVDANGEVTVPGTVNNQQIAQMKRGGFAIERIDDQGNTVFKLVDKNAPDEILTDARTPGDFGGGDRGPLPGEQTGRRAFFPRPFNNLIDDLRGAIQQDAGPDAVRMLMEEADQTLSSEQDIHVALQNMQRLDAALIDARESMVPNEFAMLDGLSQISRDRYDLLARQTAQRLSSTRQMIEPPPPTPPEPTYVPPVRPGELDPRMAQRIEDVGSTQWDMTPRMGQQELPFGPLRENAQLERISQAQPEPIDLSMPEQLDLQLDPAPPPPPPGWVDTGEPFNQGEPYNPFPQISRDDMTRMTLDAIRKAKNLEGQQPLGATKPDAVQDLIDKAKNVTPEGPPDKLEIFSRMKKRLDEGMISPEDYKAEKNALIIKFDKGLPRARSFADTRFILPNGTRLTHNNQYHVYAAEAVGARLDDAMDAGIIRFTGGGTAAEVTSRITKEQATQLMDSMTYSGRPLYMDVAGPGGRKYKIFDPDRTEPSQIREWINSQFTDEIFAKARKADTQANKDYQETWDLIQRNSAKYEGRNINDIKTPLTKEQQIIADSYDRIREYQRTYDQWWQAQENQLPEGEFYKAPIEIEEAYGAKLDEMLDKHQALVDRLDPLEKPPKPDIETENLTPARRLISDGSPDVDNTSLYSKLPKEESDEVIKKLRWAYPATDDFKDARFLLPDGTKLKFNSRIIHEEAAGELEYELGHVLDAGVARLRGTSAEVTTKITREQAAQLESAMFHLEEPLYIDVSHPDGRGINSKVFFQTRHKAGSIYSWVNSHFDEMGHYKPDDGAGLDTRAQKPRSDEGSVNLAGLANIPKRLRRLQNRSADAFKGLFKEGPDGKPSVAEETVGLSTALTTTGDLSAAMRQGLPQIWTKEWWQALGPMLKGAWSPEMAAAIHADIMKKPIFQRKVNLKTKKAMKSVAEEAGVKMIEPGNITKSEMEIGSNWAETGGSIPYLSRAYRETAGRYVRASNRAYATFLNHLRANSLENLMNGARDMSITALQTGEAKRGMFFKEQFTPQEALELNPYKNKELAKELGDFINTVTGRAPLKTHLAPGTPEINLEFMMKGLKWILFSPRLLASRVRMMNPNTYILASPMVRKQYLKSAAATAGTWYGIQKLASQHPDVEVTMDTDSADFGKIKVGNTRLDPGGGFLQFVVAISRLMTGGYTSSSSGEWHRFGEGFQATSQRESWERFYSNKLNPLAKFAWDMASATEYQPFHVKDRIIQLYIPLIMQDAIELYNEDPKSMWMLGPIAAGMGTQTYEKGESVGKFVDQDNDWLATGGGLRDLLPESIRPGDY